MELHQPTRPIKIGWVLILLGIVYSIVIRYQHTLTGINEVDGAIGVLLGLYICSHPAANVVDKLFFRRGPGRLFSTKRSAVLWLAHNGVVLLIGWVVMFIGTTRFFTKMD